MREREDIRDVKSTPVNAYIFELVRPFNHRMMPMTSVTVE